MMGNPAWRECLVTAVVAALLWLVVALGGSGDDGDDGGPLLGAAPDVIAVAYGDNGYRLELTGEQPRLFDTTGEVLGRAWRREVRAIAEALAEVRILRRVELGAEGDWASYGLADPLRLSVGARELVIGGVGIDRGYVRAGDELLVLDHDLGALLRRPPAVLRAPTLELEGALAVAHDEGWRLVRERERWWLHPAGGGERRWVDQALATAWLQTLTAAPVVGFAPAAEAGAPRSTLVIERGGGLAPVGLADLGPADAEDNRLLRRSEGKVAEHLVVALDALLLDPEPATFINSALLPLDPSTAEAVRIGAIGLQRVDGRWTVDGRADVDRSRIDRLLERLAGWQRAGAHQPSERPLVTVERGGLRFDLRERDPRVLQLLRELAPHHLRDRHLLPELDPEDISDLIIQPRAGAPEIYTRSDGEWPADERAEIEALLDGLLSARVEEWRGPLDERDQREQYDSTVTIAAGEHQHTLRLRADGMVAVLGRDLAGPLDAASRRKVFGE